MKNYVKRSTDILKSEGQITSRSSSWKITLRLVRWMSKYKLKINEVGRNKWSQNQRDEITQAHKIEKYLWG